MEKEVYAVTYKVVGTEDVFVTTSETKDALDRHDIPYNLLAEEDGARIAVFHSPLSREELAEYEEAIRALALAWRAIAVACVGVNGESNLGCDLTAGGATCYTYFTAPAGHIVHLAAVPRARRRGGLPHQADGGRQEGRRVGGVDSAPHVEGPQVLPLTGPGGALL